MLFLLENLAAWVAAALALGFAFGLLACRGAAGRSGKLGSLLAVLACGGGVIAAYLNLAPGEYGLWLEAGLVIGAAYGAGGVCGCLLRRLFKKGAVTAAPQSPGVLAIDRREAQETATGVTIAAPEAVEASLAPEPPLESEETPAPAAMANEQGEDRTDKLKSQPEGDDLRLIHGLDRESGRVLQELGAGGLAELAALSRAGRAEIATRLGMDAAVVSYWAAQARLLVHGVPIGFSREPDGADAAPLDGGTADALSASLPQAAPPQAQDKFYPGMRPFGLLAPPGGEKDPLARVVGIDPAAEKALNALGIWTFRQIAAWTPDNCRWIDSYLAAPGRITREEWIEQAAALAGAAPIGA